MTDYAIAWCYRPGVYSPQPGRWNLSTATRQAETSSPPVWEGDTGQPLAMPIVAVVNPANPNEVPASVAYRGALYRHQVGLEPGEILDEDPEHLYLLCGWPVDGQPSSSRDYVVSRLSYHYGLAESLIHARWSSYLRVHYVQGPLGHWPGLVGVFDGDRSAGPPICLVIDGVFFVRSLIPIRSLIPTRQPAVGSGVETAEVVAEPN